MCSLSALGRAKLFSPVGWQTSHEYRRFEASRGISWAFRLALLVLRSFTVDELEARELETLREDWAIGGARPWASGGG